jgi:hypothetical protein
LRGGTGLGGLCSDREDEAEEWEAEEEYEVEPVLP